MSRVVKEEPYYKCLILFKGHVKCYPMVDYSRPELDKKVTDEDLVGGWIYPEKDNTIRDVYINEIEERLKDQ